MSYAAIHPDWEKPRRNMVDGYSLEITFAISFEPAQVRARQLERRATLTHGREGVTVEAGEAAARVGLRVPGGGQGGGIVREGNRAHAELIEGVEDVQASVQRVAVLDHQHGGGAPLLAGAQDVVGTADHGAGVRMAVQVGEEVADCVRCGGEVVVARQGDVHGKERRIDAGLAHRR